MNTYDDTITAFNFSRHVHRKIISIHALISKKTRLVRGTRIETRDFSRLQGERFTISAQGTGRGDRERAEDDEEDVMNPRD